MAYTPVVMQRGNQSEVADTAEEFYNLLWRGWTPTDGEVPTPPAFSQRELEALEAYKDRQNHTGTQTADTISDFIAAVIDAFYDGVELDELSGKAIITLTGDGGGDADDPVAEAERVRDMLATALVNGGNIQIVPDDEGNTIALAVTGLDVDDIAGLQSALNGKADSSHTHSGAQIQDNSLPISKLDATGTRSSSTFLRGDNTFGTPANPTTASQGEAEAGSSTTVRSWSPQRVRQAAQASPFTAAQVSAAFTEAAQDAVAAMLVSGANVTLTYDDNANTLQVTAAGGDAEVMRDTIGAALVGTGGIGVAVNDAADTITITISAVTIAQVTGLQTALDGKSATGHTHTIANVTGLQAALDGKRTATAMDPIVIVETSTGVWSGDAPAGRSAGDRPCEFRGDSDPADPIDGIATPANIVDWDVWVHPTAP